MWLMKKMFKLLKPKDRPKVKKPYTHKGEKGALLECSGKLLLPSGASEIFDISEDGVDYDRSLCRKSELDKNVVGAQQVHSVPTATKYVQRILTFAPS